jgi:HK97 family phage major capsid protein
MSSLTQEIEKRQAAAEAKAREAATRAVDGTFSLPDELAVEEALEDLFRYSALNRDLRAVAEELGPYGQRSQSSVLQDLARERAGDEVAKKRLAEHRRTEHEQERLPIEARDITSGNFTTIPNWLVTDRAPTAIPSSPIVSIAKPLPLQSGQIINLTGFASSPPVGAMQNGPGGALATNDPTDTAVALPIKTGYSETVVSLQLLEQGRPGIDAQYLPALADATDAALDSSMVNGTGSGGDFTGLLHVAGTATASYTDTTGSVAGFITAVEGLTRTIEGNGMKSGQPVWVFHPRRWSWFRESLATASAPNGGSLTRPLLPGAVATWQGSVSIMVDPNLPTTAGVGTNEDRVIVVRGPVGVRAWSGLPSRLLYTRHRLWPRVSEGDTCRRVATGGERNRTG